MIVAVPSDFSPPPEAEVSFAAVSWLMSMEVPSIIIEGKHDKQAPVSTSAVRLTPGASMPTRWIGVVALLNSSALVRSVGSAFAMYCCCCSDSPSAFS